MRSQARLLQMNRSTQFVHTKSNLMKKTPQPAHDCSWLSIFHHTRYQKNGVEWSRTVLQHITLRHFTSKTHWHDIAWLHGIFTALTVFPTKWLPFQRTAKHLRLREVSLIASVENVLLHRKRAWMQFPAIPRTISQSCDFGVQSRD